MAEDAYFQPPRAEAQPDPGLPPRYVQLADVPWVRLSPGVRTQAVAGGSLLLSFVRLDPHGEAPLHAHAEEQCGVVLEGELEFELGGMRRTLHPGDIYMAPPHVPHAARTGEQSCLVLDVFSPPRAAILALLAQASGAMDQDA